MSKALIFIPGIKGTKLHDSNTLNNEILWQDFRFNFKDTDRLHLTFEFENDYFEEDMNTIIHPDSIEPLAYREFWNRLDPDYPNKFIFAYDWRISNKTNGEKLRQFILYLIKKSKAIGQPIVQFDIVTHSMGNMPIRFYIKEYGMEFINKVIFTAPPFKGAPEAISALVVGQGMFFKKDETRKLARTLPGLFELLPSYPHYAIDHLDGSDIDLFQLANWQETILTIDPNERNKPQKQKLIEKFKANLAKCKTVLDELDSWMNELSVAEKNRILVLVKTEMKTLCNIVVEKNPNSNPKNYFNIEESLISEEGDGVVPDASSCYYCNELATYAFENRPVLDDFQHAFFLKDNRVQKVINEFLRRDADTTVFSPVDLIGSRVKKVHRMIEIPIEGNENHLALNGTKLIWKING